MRSTHLLAVLPLLAVAVLALMAAADTGADIRAAPAPPRPSGQVAGGGVTLASQAVDFPDPDDAYPAGPGAEVMNANCTVCHSASMALYQPPLSEADWQGEVTKMRETYKAVIADRDVPAIVAYLTRMSRGSAGSSRLAPRPSGAADTAG